MGMLDPFLMNIKWPTWSSYKSVVIWSSEWQRPVPRGSWFLGYQWPHLPGLSLHWRTLTWVTRRWSERHSLRSERGSAVLHFPLQSVKGEQQSPEYKGSIACSIHCALMWPRRLCLWLSWCASILRKGNYLGTRNEHLPGELCVWRWENIPSQTRLRLHVAVLQLSVTKGSSEQTRGELKERRPAFGINHAIY